MDKLVALLNEYEKERKSWFTWRSIDSYDNCVYGVDCDWETEITMYSDLYSKYYGFIKRLVDNDKIELSSRNALFISEDAENWEKQRPYSFYEEMLIRLAISDTPIEDLISYLK